MPQTVKFTDATLPEAATLFVSVFNSPPWNEQWNEMSAQQRLGDLLGSPGFRGVACVDGDKVLGFAVGRAERWFSGLHFILNEMCVRTEMQGHGIGGQLLEALEERLNDVEQCYLSTRRDSPARRFYEKHGYHVAGRHAVMTKRLR